MNPPRYTLGEVVSVRAWWTRPQGQTVKCKVVEVEDSQDPACPWRNREHPHGYLVQPTENPGAHKRFVRETEII
jgi:hypothetical protein